MQKLSSQLKCCRLVLNFMQILWFRIFNVTRLYYGITIVLCCLWFQGNVGFYFTYSAIHHPGKTVKIVAYPKWRFMRVGFCDVHVNFCCVPRNVFTVLLANVNSRSRSLYVIICRLSVTFGQSTQTIEIFSNVSTPFGTLAICWLPGKILRRSSQRKPSVWSVKCKRGSQI